MPTRIHIDGVDIDITRKKMKNIRLVVQPPEGAVRLSAPTRVTKTDIVHFISANIAWIKDQQRLISQRHYPAGPSFQAGELHRHWGEEKVLRLLPYAKRRASYADEGAIYLAHPGSVEDFALSDREHMLGEFYRRECAIAIPAFIEKYSQAYGVQVNEWRLRRMKTRWGSCNIGAARIWFNIALAAYPQWCLEYVVVHEIAHLLERYHNARFWRLVETQFPAWRDARNRLNGGV